MRITEHLNPRSRSFDTIPRLMGQACRKAAPCRFRRRPQDLAPLCGREASKSDRVVGDVAVKIHERRKRAKTRAQNRTGSLIGLSFGGTNASLSASLAVAPASVERTLVETGDLCDGRRSPRLNSAAERRPGRDRHVPAADAALEAAGRASGKTGKPFARPSPAGLSI